MNLLTNEKIEHLKERIKDILNNSKISIEKVKFFEDNGDYVHSGVKKIWHNIGVEIFFTDGGSVTFVIEEDKGAEKAEQLVMGLKSKELPRPKLPYKLIGTKSWKIRRTASECKNEWYSYKILDINNLCEFEKALIECIETFKREEGL